MEITSKWNKDLKSHEEETNKGNNLLKHYMPNFDVFQETDLYKSDMPFVLVENLKEEIKDIESIIYDEKTEELFVLTKDNQYKFNVDNHVMFVNDFPTYTKQYYVPEGKVLIKK